WKQEKNIQEANNIERLLQLLQLLQQAQDQIDRLSKNTTEAVILMSQIKQAFNAQNIEDNKIMENLEGWKKKQLQENVEPIKLQVGQKLKEIEDIVTQASQLEEKFHSSIEKIRKTKIQTKD